MRCSRVRGHACPPATTTCATSRACNERGILDDGLRDAALDPAPPEYRAPLYVFLAGQMSNGITGESSVPAGGFIGRYDPRSRRFIAYRDHNDSDPYSLDELAALLG